MEKYCLYVLFQLTSDKGEKHQHTISFEADCENIDEAENLLNQKISEKLSHFSHSGLNWKIMEKHVRLETLDIEIRDKKILRGLLL